MSGKYVLRDDKTREKVLATRPTSPVPSGLIDRGSAAFLFLGTAKTNETNVTITKR